MSPIKTHAVLAAASLALAAAPLAAQGVVAIEGGTVYTLTGAPIEGGTVLIRDGRIAAVGRDVAVPAGARRVDARGKRVTPGLFESNTRIGLTEVGAVPGTNDFTLADQDEDRIMAAFDVADGLNPASIVIPVTRIAGVTTAVAAPGGGGLVNGKGVVIDLAGDDARDMLVKDPVAMYATLGEGVETAGGGARGGTTMRLRELLEDTRAYVRQRSDFERGETREFAASRLDLQAMIPVIQGRLPLVVEAHRASDLRTALRLADEYGLKLILLGASEGWMVADEIARARVPVIVKVLQNLPSSFERLGSRYDNAALLRRAGVQVAITTGDTHNARNVRQEAGNAVAYGLPWDEALRAVTLYPAQIWGVADTHGSLAPGKVADVVVWDGDPLELMTSVEHVFIGGREVPLTSRQTELRDRYRRLDENVRVYTTP